MIFMWPFDFFKRRREEKARINALTERAKSVGDTEKENYQREKEYFLTELRAISNALLKFNSNIGKNETSEACQYAAGKIDEFRGFVQRHSVPGRGFYDLEMFEQFYTPIMGNLNQALDGFSGEKRAELFAVKTRFAALLKRGMK